MKLFDFFKKSKIKKEATEKDATEKAEEIVKENKIAEFIKHIQETFDKFPWIKDGFSYLALLVTFVADVFFDNYKISTKEGKSAKKLVFDAVRILIIVCNKLADKFDADENARKKSVAEIVAKHIHTVKDELDAYKQWKSSKNKS